MKRDALPAWENLRQPTARRYRPESGIGAALAASLGLLGLLCLLQLWALWRAPDAWLPASISVRLAPGESAVLGRRELAAPQADSPHIGLRRDAAGAWWLHNLSASRQVLLQSDAGERRIGNAALQAGQSFQVDATRFQVNVADAEAGTVTFSRDGQRWTYDGALLYRDGVALVPCPDARLAARALRLWNRALPAVFSIGRPLQFGGNLYCDNRLGLAGIAPGAASIARAPGTRQLQLRPGDGDADAGATALQLFQNGSALDLRRQEQPLAGIHTIVAGHTRFQVTLGEPGNQLSLLPGRRVALFSAPEATLAPGIDWVWKQRSLWRGAAQTPLCMGLALAMAALAAGASVRNMQWRWRASALAALTVLLGGVAALVLQRTGQPPAAAVSLALSSAALGLWLLIPGPLSPATVAAVLLLATGLLAQLDLGLGGSDTSWLRYYQKSAALLAIGSGLGALWRCWCHWRPRAQGVASQRGVETALALLAVAALVALALQVLWGDETGVFDVQPVELAKLALTALTAHCLALRLGWHEAQASLPGRAARWLRLAAPALLFAALLGLALVQVDDYSPLILLLVWSTAMAFAYALAVRHRPLAIGLGLLVLAAVGAIVALRSAGGDELIGWGFYAERFLVWLSPERHPHTGQQLLLGAHAIVDGGWWGSDNLLGLASLGRPAGSALTIPAVQDDFAPAFFLHRHGLIGALLLWTLQAAFVLALLHTAQQAHAGALAARDFRHAWQGRWRYFALCGGAAFVLGHLLLSWGTNLAIFPIMGQPMSFLSAGGSHLLFFLCPLLVLDAVSAPSLEEKVSCRSMSSTKS